MNPITRREMILGLSAMGGATMIGAPTALAHYNPRKLKKAAMTTDGGQRVEATFADLDDTPAPAVLLVHEKWGLTGGARWLASEFGRQGFLAIAVDLYEGEIIDDETKASGRMAALDPERTLDLLTSWTRWLKANFLCTGKVGIVGWGHGAHWALASAAREPVDAAVVYYPEGQTRLAAGQQPQGPVMAHFPASELPAFDQSLLGGKPIVYDYPAKTGFADAFRSNFDDRADRLSWKRSLTFLREHLPRK